MKSHKSHKNPRKSHKSQKAEKPPTLKNKKILKKTKTIPKKNGPPGSSLKFHQVLVVFAPAQLHFPGRGGRGESQQREPPPLPPRPKGRSAGSLSVFLPHPKGDPHFGNASCPGRVLRTCRCAVVRRALSTFGCPMCIFSQGPKPVFPGPLD